MKKFIVIVALIFMGCNQYYTKYNGDYGYSDLEYSHKIEVSYVGTTDMTTTDSKKYALYRIAHIAFLNNMKYVKIIEEKVSKNKVRVKQDAQTNYTEKTDSLGNKEIQMTSTPKVESISIKPTVVMVGIETNECDSNCLDVTDMVRKAELENIIVSKH